MIQLLLSLIPSTLDKMLPFLPGFAKALILKEIQKSVEKTTPEQIAKLNQLIEDWLDAVARRDFETIGSMFERYNVPPGGAVEQVTARLMGLGLMPPPYEQNQETFEGRPVKHTSEVMTPEVERYLARHSDR